MGLKSWVIPAFLLFNLPAIPSLGAPSITIPAGKLVVQEGGFVQTGPLRLSMRTDGNLVLTNGSSTLWSSDTSGQCSHCEARFQDNGVLSVFNRDTGQVLYNSPTIGATTLKLTEAAPHLTIDSPSVSWNGSRDFLTFTYLSFNLVPGQSWALNGAKLILTSSADLQVVDATNTILWRTNTFASCTGNTSCRAVLQNDGNLVVYGPQGALWASNTWGQSIAALIFSNTAPYLTLLRANTTVAWSTSGTSIPTPAVASLSELKGPRAVATSQFLDSLGVNTHMNQYEQNVTQMLGKLQYLGVRTIRDFYVKGGGFLSNYQTLAAAGIRFNMLGNPNNPTTFVSDAVDLVALSPGGLRSIEGPNEINNFPFSCNGSSWAGGWPNDNGPAAQCYMTNAYTSLKATASLNGIFMYDLSGGNSARNADQYGLLRLLGHAHYGNVHVYPDGVPGPGSTYPASSQQPRNALATATLGTYLWTPPSAAVITEFGYTTAISTGCGTYPGLSATAQAIQLLNFYLDAFYLGYHQAFIYELTDNCYEGFGLYDSSHNPKTSAHAIHNMTTILADTGSSTNPGSLNSIITNLPSTARTLLLQKSNGSFQLLIWNEPVIFANGLDQAIAPTSITISWGSNFSSVRLFNPLTGTLPIQTWNQTSTVTFALAGQPLILEINP